MAAETNLPPEVAEALDMIGDLHPHGIPTVEGLAAYRATRTLRDYLSRVTSRGCTTAAGTIRATTNVAAGTSADAAE